ncbi:uncharacterized protein LOC126727927 [Quercus robur]|uniref:uncharacterized protein LOC126727927 n=1 Tax=Quercus robur TaxID=38942 RepID=UPI00216277D4|nr:uncharacterized protein LOC126727927 [Quercus robur]
MEVIAKTFTPLWRARNGFKIQNFGDQKILFTFDNREDVDWILGGEPWSFDKHLVVMSRYENESPLQDIKFDRTTLWVQVHGIPIKYMIIEAAKKICSVVGEVFTPTDPKLYDGDHFICVQVSIDLSLPLRRGRLISVGEGKHVWISFKYERLPNLCYWCGQLTHNDKDCELWKSVIKVPGFYVAKKKISSNTSVDRNPCRKSNFGKGKAPEQSQNVTASSDAENISPLMRNDFGGVIREETVFLNQSNAIIIEEIKSPTKTKIELKVNNEEISLAKEFGVAKFVGNRKKDSSLKAKVNEEITVELNKINETVFDLEITVELNKINETVSDLEANNEEVCLAKEFRAATLLGVAKRATKNPTS